MGQVRNGNDGSTLAPGKIGKQILNFQSISSGCQKARHLFELG